MDKVESIENVLIHHGKFNDRLYILKFPQNGNHELVNLITNMAIKKGYSKIVGKIPEKVLPFFLSDGYNVESSIPNFYKGVGDCFFVSKFINHNRATYNPHSLNEFKAILKTHPLKVDDDCKHNYIIRALTKSDVAEMLVVFKEVFATYPFPIHNVDYILHTIESNVVYFGVFIDKKLCGISSAEMDLENNNVEMTDFAVVESARGHGLSKLLLKHMEKEMKKRKIKTLYTIARLESIPMNKTFLSAGYNYAGTLINNTNISGGIESMNILYKHV